MTLTPVVEAVILVVVLVVVLQAGGAAGAQLGQSAAGGGELGAEVGHFLAGRLDGPIDPVCQVFVVFHHFKDFPLRTKPTQSSMMSSGVKPELSLLPLFPLFYLLLILHLCSFPHSLLRTRARYSEKESPSQPLSLSSAGMTPACERREEKKVGAGNRGGAE